MNVYFSMNYVGRYGYFFSIAFNIFVRNMIISFSEWVKNLKPSIQLR